MIGSVRARLVVALAALALLLPGSAFFRAQYLCRMANRVVSKCCCKSHERLETPPCGPSVKGTDCCQKVTPSDGRAVASTTKVDCSVAAAAFEEAPGPEVQSRVPGLVSIELPIRARAPPALGPPLFILHRRLLT